MSEAIGRSTGPRCIALVGPFQSGKTSLLEAVLERCGAVAKAGRVSDGSSFGDSGPEARAHGHGIEPAFATVDHGGEAFTFVDCPGSPEFMHAMRAVLPACDAAVVVCEPDERKLPALQAVLREVEEARLPRILFLNKIDDAATGAADAVRALQPASRMPLLMRQLPLTSNGIVVGHVDLALERAFVFREHAASEVIAIPPDMAPLEKEARFAMLEKLADHDDALLEELLSEIEPSRDQVFDDLRKEVRAGLVVPVLLGNALKGHGVGRLLKAIRHDAPGVRETRSRLGLAADGPPLAHVMRTIHAQHGGRSSIARVLRGRFKEGDAAVDSDGHEARIGPLASAGRTDGNGRSTEAAEGTTASFGRLEGFPTGAAFMTGRTPPPRIATVDPPHSVHALALAAHDPKDDAKLATALAKMVEEDPGLVVIHDGETHEVRLGGQGEVHLRVAVEKLTRSGVRIEVSPPRVDYRETIRHAVKVRGRHKKQTGGHGQFGDVVIAVSPLPRGAGFVFIDEIAGGVVPRQYIASVEHGVREAMKKGPLGRPVVDVQVKLVDGSHHSVDSSDMAFRAAGRLAMSDALEQAGSVLLEPVLALDAAVPTDATARTGAIISGRRGRILGFDARPDWPGWDVVQALIPESETHDLIVELRSATAGAGSFRTRFDHLAEVVGREAENAARRSRS